MAENPAKSKAEAHTEDLPQGSTAPPSAFNPPAGETPRSAKLFGLIHRIASTLDSNTLAEMNALYVELQAEEATRGTPPGTPAPVTQAGQVGSRVPDPPPARK